MGERVPAAVSETTKMTAWCRSVAVSSLRRKKGYGGVFVSISVVLVIVRCVCKHQCCVGYCKVSLLQC